MPNKLVTGGMRVLIQQKSGTPTPWAVENVDDGFVVTFASAMSGLTFRYEILM